MPKRMTHSQRLMNLYAALRPFIPKGTQPEQYVNCPRNNVRMYEVFNIPGVSRSFTMTGPQLDHYIEGLRTAIKVLVERSTLVKIDTGFSDGYKKGKEWIGDKLGKQEKCFVCKGSGREGLFLCKGCGGVGTITVNRSES